MEEIIHVIFDEENCEIHSTDDDTRCGLVQDSEDEQSQEGLKDKTLAKAIEEAREIRGIINTHNPKEELQASGRTNHEEESTYKLNAFVPSQTGAGRNWNIKSLIPWKTSSHL